MESRDWPAIVLAGLVPVVFSPALAHPVWAPKAALLLLALGPGLVALVALARSGDVAARFGMAFVVAASVSCALADRPVLSLFGPANFGTGLLFAAALPAMWALGRGLSQAGRRALVWVLLAAATANAALAFVQAGVDRVGIDALERQFGRAQGFMGNPVYMGALVAAALAVCATQGSVRRRSFMLVAAAALAGAAQASGGRSALVLAAAGVLVAAVRSGPRWGTALLVAAAIGVMAAGGITTGAGDSSATAQLGTARVAGHAGDEVGVRLDLWGAGMRGLRDRPLLGWGPGRYEAAATPHRTLRLAGGSPEAHWTDAHNAVVEYATTTGVIGVALLAAFVLIALMRARGALAGFAVLGLAAAMVEPLSVAVTPLAALALGAAGRDGPVAGRWPRAAVLTSALGAALAVLLLAGEVSLRAAVVDFSADLHRRAALLLPSWPEVGQSGARIATLENRRDDGIRLARAAVADDPTDFESWHLLASLEALAGRRTAAQRHFEEALRRNPWSASALGGLARLARERGDTEARAAACARLALLNAACLSGR